MESANPNNTTVSAIVWKKHHDHMRDIRNFAKRKYGIDITNAHMLNFRRSDTLLPTECIDCINEAEKVCQIEYNEAESFKVLKSSANRGEWQGTPNVAIHVAKSIAHLVPQERRDELWKESPDYGRKYNAENMPIRDLTYFYSELIVIECIRQHNDELKQLIEGR